MSTSNSNPLAKSLFSRLFKKRKKTKKVIDSILILRFSSIGDILLTTPIVRCLRKKYPQAKIYYLTKKKYAHVLEANPYIDDILTIEDKVAEIGGILSQLNIKLYVDLHKNIRSQQVRTFVKSAKYYSFNKLNFKKWLFVNLKVNLLPEESIVNRYFKGLKKIKLQNDMEGLDYFIPPNQYIDTKADIPYSHHMGYVAIGIGGSKNTKKMPYHKWQALCDQIEYPIIVVGGEEDREVGELLAQNSPDKKVYSACGKFNLHESADILRRSTQVITHDTAAMHIAAAFNKPIIVTWGNTHKDFGMYPYLKGESKAWISAEQHPRCRPCSKIGYDKCPKKHFKCMETQDLEFILDETDKQLKAVMQEKELANIS